MFCKATKKPTGYSTWCKDCESAHYSEDRKKNPEKFTRLNRRTRMRNYGLTPEDYEKMFMNQSGLCACCGKLQRGNQKLVIDHNHQTKRVRGLVHRYCNVAIGVVESRDGLLQKAQEYVQKHQ